MPDTSTRMLLAFRHEMKKEAVSVTSALQRLGRAVHSPTMAGAFGGAGAGGLLGAGAGGVHGAVTGYREAREQGGTVGQSLLGGVERGVSGATRGAMLGAAAGGVGGGMLSSKFKEAPAMLAAAPGPVGAGARFGQRQLHGLTGWTPKGGLRSIRGGGYEAAKNVEKAQGRLRGAQAAGEAPAVARAEKELASGKKALQASGRAEFEGLTSLPGYAKALARDPVRALKTGFGEQWHSMPPAMRALVYGSSGLAAAQAAATPSEPGGPGRVERTARAVGSALPFMAGPLPTAATLLATPVAGALAGRAGRAVDRTFGRHRPAAPEPESDRGMSAPTEYVYSDRAMGLMPEGMIA